MIRCVTDGMTPRPVYIPTGIVRQLRALATNATRSAPSGPSCVASRASWLSQAAAAWSSTRPFGARSRLQLARRDARRGQPARGRRWRPKRS